MASSAKRPKQRVSLDDVIDEIFADSDSEVSEFGQNSDTLESESSDDESEPSRQEDDYVSPVDGHDISDSSGSERSQSSGSGSDDGSRGRGRGQLRGRGQGRGQGHRGRGRGNADDASWSRTDRQPNVDPFTGQPGMNVQMDANAEPIDYLRLFITDELIDILVNETNLYAGQYIRNRRIAEKSRVKKWRDVTTEEMWKYLALLFLTVVVKKPTLNMYWTSDPMLATTFFGSVMSRDRFLNIARFFHCNNNDARPNPCDDRIYKVRPVYDLLVQKFREVYTPGEHLALDEGMLKWRGRLVFRVYNPPKPDKYGMKAYIVCESNSGYVYGYSLYHGL